MDGYAIFVVDGDLPKSPAESELLLCPLNVKEVLASYKTSTARGAKGAANKNDEDDDDDYEEDDEELKKALKMSLIENDIELDRSRASSKLYPSLVHEQIKVNDYGGKRDEEGDYESELRRAIEMSLQQASTSAAAATSAASSSSSTAAAAGDSTSQLNDSESIRAKRLKYLENMAKNKNEEK